MENEKVPENYLSKLQSQDKCLTHKVVQWRGERKKEQKKNVTKSLNFNLYPHKLTNSGALSQKMCYICSVPLPLYWSLW